MVLPGRPAVTKLFMRYVFNLPRRSYFAASGQQREQGQNCMWGGRVRYTIRGTSE